MHYTHATKKAVGASNTNGLHTYTNSADFRSHRQLNQVSACRKGMTSTSEKRAPHE
jgi:hypothetical protein